MKPFIHDDFLLKSDLAAQLYHEVAAELPVIDYHCHLPPDQIATNHRFSTVTEAWLFGDHYKWRAMRSSGVPERFCTGDASEWEKFEAWARTVPQVLRNPLYHWTHMELRRPFGVHELLSPATAKATYDRCNELLSRPEFTTQGLLAGFRVAVVCTTDDPIDSLEHHAALAERQNPVTRVYPTWRPDRAFDVLDAEAWNLWVGQLERAAGTSIATLAQFMGAMDQRHAAFHALGCRASDHGLEAMDAEPWTDADVERDFDELRRGRGLDPSRARRLRSALIHRLALMDQERGWVQQFHLGALRDNNSRMRRLLGRDTGCDSIGDFEQARPLARFLDKLDGLGRLPRTILYNLNPRDNELFASMAGNFQDGSVAGKLQFGAAWWFLDQLDGMRKQLDTLSNLGVLSAFVGMITDSRSFLSYSRHEYYRRLLCDMLAEDVRAGLVPDNREALGRLVRRLSFFNARDYFGFELGSAADGVATQAP